MCSSTHRHLSRFVWHDISDDHPNALAVRLRLDAALRFLPRQQLGALPSRVGSYLALLPHVQAECRLSPDEMEELLSMFPDNRTDHTRRRALELGQLPKPPTTSAGAGAGAGAGSGAGAGAGGAGGGYDKADSVQVRLPPPSVSARLLQVPRDGAATKHGAHVLPQRPVSPTPQLVPLATEGFTFSQLGSLWQTEHRGESVYQLIYNASHAKAFVLQHAELCEDAAVDVSASTSALGSLLLCWLRHRLDTGFELRRAVVMPGLVCMLGAHAVEQQLSTTRRRPSRLNYALTWAEELPGPASQPSSGVPQSVTAGRHVQVTPLSTALQPRSSHAHITAAALAELCDKPLLEPLRRIHNSKVGSDGGGALEQAVRDLEHSHVAAIAQSLEELRARDMAVAADLMDAIVSRVALVRTGAAIMFMIATHT